MAYEWRGWLSKMAGFTENKELNEIDSSESLASMFEILSSMQIWFHLFKIA